MAQSFSLSPGQQNDASTSRRRVLVTGAAGSIGLYFAEHAPERYELRLMVLGDEDPGQIEKLKPFGEIVRGDVGDLDRMRAVCEGIDTVLHLAGNPSPSAMWDSLLKVNIIGTYNVFTAAKLAACRRVVYASSIHAISGYPADVQVKTSEPVNPGDLYGVSKCFGEAFARYMAEQEGLSAICLRIGAFQPLAKAKYDGSIPLMDAFVSDRDLQQLIERSIDAERLHFAIFQGLSDNRFKRMDISDARELVGYEPQDDFTEENPRVGALRLRERSHGHNVKDEAQKSGMRNEVEERQRTRNL